MSQIVTGTVRRKSRQLEQDSHRRRVRGVMIKHLQVSWKTDLFNWVERGQSVFSLPLFLPLASGKENHRYLLVRSVVFSDRNETSFNLTVQWSAKCRINGRKQSIQIQIL